MVQHQERDPEVEHPSHYGGEGNPLEVVNILEHYELNHHLASAVEYILRARAKHPTLAGYLRDLKKARWWLDRQIANVELQLAEHQAQANMAFEETHSKVIPRRKAAGARTA